MKETTPSQIIKIYITVIVKIWYIFCSREFSDVVAGNFITKLLTDKLYTLFSQYWNESFKNKHLWPYLNELLNCFLISQGIAQT